jgi:hypothetical protein
MILFLFTVYFCVLMFYHLSNSSFNYIYFVAVPRKYCRSLFSANLFIVLLKCCNKVLTKSIDCSTGTFFENRDYGTGFMGPRIPVLLPGQREILNV